MPLFAVIGLDLQDLAVEQRQKLKAGLPLDWSQAGGQSVWWSRLDESEPTGAATRTLEVIVGAARSAGISRLPAIVTVSNTPPVLAADVLVVSTTDDRAR